MTMGTVEVNIPFDDEEQLNQIIAALTDVAENELHDCAFEVEVIME